MTIAANHHRKDNYHPVHMIDEKGRVSPSAFIPFCEIAGNWSSMGMEFNWSSIGVKFERMDVRINA